MFTWGKCDSSSSPITQSSSSSFQDIINEELKRSRPKNELLEISTTTNSASKKKPDAVSSIPQIISSAAAKKWDMHKAEAPNKESSSQSSKESFAKIVEMENNMQQYYKSMKNRPLNLIQLEEKAMQEMNKLYNVENTTNMLITIEFVDDAPHMAPTWKRPNF